MGVYDSLVTKYNVWKRPTASPNTAERLPTQPRVKMKIRA